MRDYLTPCANNGVVANAPKVQFCKDTVEFSGLSITPTGVIPSAKMLSPTYDFPKSIDLTSARSWFGLYNQTALDYSISSVMQTFRDLIRSNQKFYWDDNLDKLFELSKQVIIDLVKEAIQSFELTHQTDIIHSTRLECRWCWLFSPAETL